MAVGTTLRAKFEVRERTEHAWTDESERRHVESVGLVLHPVYSPDPTTENYAFWNATPGGQLQMTITNPSAFDFFQEGAEVYLDFTIAKPAPQVSA
jgi:hypothetical protein